MIEEVDGCQMVKSLSDNIILSTGSSAVLASWWISKNGKLGVESVKDTEYVVIDDTVVNDDSASSLVGVRSPI